MLIHQLFEAQVNRTPQAIALWGEQGRFSYGELNSRANQVARYLAARGAGPGSRIGICCERTFELIAGVLAILKTGAAYVPMDPAYPAERLEYMAQAAGIDCVLTQSNLATRLERLQNTQSLVLDDARGEWTALSCENLELPPSGDDLIYIIFTSGTTGRPKGAAVYHRGFSNLIDWFVDEFRITAADKTLLVSSPSFDLTQKNLFAPLITGGTLCLYPPGPYDVLRLARSIHECGITLLNCTPSAFYPVVEDGGDFNQLHSLRVVFLGGEPISLLRLRPWFTNPACHAEIANTYGPTECTDICAFYRVTRSNMDDFDFVPLGGPIRNVQLVVVNEKQEACGAGEAGELYVGGAGVGAGYINDPGLTAEKFVAHNFHDVNGRLMYRTGDKVRANSAGLLEFLGRMDHQVKVRGFRIELHEVESVLRQHGSIREVVVVVKESAGHAQLKAYFSLKSGAAVTIAELRDFAAARLPEYMVPSSFERLSVFPLSPNGKVDRNALTNLAYAQPDTTIPDQSVAADELQLGILGIWTSALGVKEVGLDDNFFDVGGDSLALTQVHARLQKLVARNFPITELFAHATVRSLANHFKSPVSSAGHHQETLDRARRQRQALMAGRGCKR